MRTIKLMIDSGAYSVWTKGKAISLADYIIFCQGFPGVSYYVSLDVIAGTPKRKPSASELESAAKAGWQNYQAMCEVLPREKVIPGYHLGESLDWLKRYVDFGADYIGVGGIVKASSLTKRKLLEVVRKQSGTALLHGFGVDSFEVLNTGILHSADSFSWGLDAAWGLIYLPRKTGGKFDYSREPFTLSVSPRSVAKERRGSHLENLTPTVRELVDEYLHSCGVGLGKFSRYAGKPKSGDCWYDKKKNEAMTVVEPGIVPSAWMRQKVNVLFWQRANRVLPLGDFYFAGGSESPVVEFNTGRKLCSFSLYNTASGKQTIQTHCDGMVQCQ